MFVAQRDTIRLAYSSSVLGAGSNCAVKTSNGKTSDSCSCSQCTNGFSLASGNCIACLFGMIAVLAPMVPAGAIDNCNQFEIADYDVGGTTTCRCAACSEGYYSSDAGMTCSKHCEIDACDNIYEVHHLAGNIPHCVKAENTNSGESCTCTQCQSGYFPMSDGCESCSACRQ